MTLVMMTAPYTLSLLLLLLSVRLWPRYASALNNLAVLLDNTAEAETLYRQAVLIQPCHANAHFSLGNLLTYATVFSSLVHITWSSRTPV